MFEKVNSPLQTSIAKLLYKTLDQRQIFFFNSLFNIRYDKMSEYMMFTVDIIASLQEQWFNYPSFCGFKEVTFCCHSLRHYLGKKILYFKD